MDSPNISPTWTLTARDMFDLARAAFILFVTVIAAMVVPPKVFGANPADKDATAIVSQTRR